MILFGCDSCNAIKQPGEVWILGLAAESIGFTAARREISILPAWDDARACHELAVHFCSAEHKDSYMAALFETEPSSKQTVIETKATVSPNASTERKYMRTASSGVVTTMKKKKVVKSKRRRSA